MSAETRTLLAKVHVAKKQLRLDDDTYRAVLRRVTGKSSAKDLSAALLVSVLEEFARLGFRAVPRPASAKPWVRKIYAIWADLAPLLDGATDETLRAFVRRQTRSARAPAGVDRPEWLIPEDATKVIQGLEGWLRGASARKDAA